MDVRPLDEYCEEAAVDRLDLVKIDCEGWETFVLQGAREALRRFRPRLQVEFNPRHLAGVGWGPEDFLELLRGLGYGVYRQTRRGLVQVTSPLDVGWTVNLHCLPAGPAR